MTDTPPVEQEVAIHVDHVSKIFKLPHEKQTSVKSLVLSFRKRRSFEQQHALKNVSFDIKKGEFFGIVGRNGSGKSTLLKMIAGIYEPSKGKITLNGKLTPFIELGVGFNPELTGKENVYLNGALLGFSRKQIAKIYDEIVAFAELEKFMDQKLKNYSSGMQVRLAFSIAVRAKSDILLIDEVLAVGDAAFQQKCFDYFEELKKTGRTAILVTHDMNAVQRFCNRALMLERGSIREIGSPLEIATIYTEDNIRSISSAKGGNKETESRIEVEVTEQQEDTTTFRLTYKAEEKAKTYVGFSLLKDGLTFAEMNNREYPQMVKANTIEYQLNTSQFNPGVYEISAALFKFDNKQQLAMTKQRARFIIEGFDDTRGGAINLPNGWNKPSR